MFLGASEPSSVSYLFSKFKSLWFPLRKVYFTQVGRLNMTFYRQKNNSMSAEAKKKFSSFFRFMVRNWCFLSKSDVNVITGGKHILVSSPVSRLLLLWTGYNTLYTWLHFADPKQKEVCCTTLQCSNQGANHGTLPLHWPWPNGKCCGKAEITGEYSINKWQIKQWLASNNGLKCLWAPQTAMILLFCTWSI